MLLPARVRYGQLPATQSKVDIITYLHVSTGLEVPSTRPERCIARTATYGSRVRTTIVVSNPSRGTDPSDFRRSTLGPVSTSQLSTSVAPFQLTYTLSSSSEARSATQAGRSNGWPLHGKRKAR